MIRVEIRAALMDDIESVVELGKRGHALSRNAKYAFDEPGAKLLMAQCICNKRMCAFVAVDGDKIVGVLLGLDDTLPYLKLRIASDIVTYAESPGAGRQLLKRFTTWAFDERRVDQMLLGVTSGNVTSTTAIYKRLGFEPVGAMFTRNRK